ncbi:MAG TPA: hypothetical protein VFT31_11635, partial [Kribbella sp.]|nr:hypothetical protein [Kribbella sp.]
MDAVVLLIFANFFALLVVSTATSQGMLRASVHRPRLFQLAVIGSAAATVPVDLYAVFHGTIGSSGA